MASCRSPRTPLAARLLLKAAPCARYSPVLAARSTPHALGDGRADDFAAGLLASAILLSISLDSSAGTPKPRRSRLLAMFSLADVDDPTAERSSFIYSRRIGRLAAPAPAPAS